MAKDIQKQSLFNGMTTVQIPKKPKSEVVKTAPEAGTEQKESEDMTPKNNQQEPNATSDKTPVQKNDNAASNAKRGRGASAKNSANTLSISSLSTAKRESKSIHRSILITPSLNDRLKAMSIRTNLSVNELIETILNKVMDDLENSDEYY